MGRVDRESQAGSDSGVPRRFMDNALLFARMPKNPDSKLDVLSGCGIDQALRRWRFGHQDPHATTFGQESKPPLQYHKQAIGKSNKKVNMHDCPECPG